MEGTPGASGVPSRFFRRAQRGFTLVELMISVAIIGILVSVAIPNFLRMRERAKSSEAKANLGAIRVSEHAHFAEYSHYVGNQGLTPDRTTTPAARIPWADGTRFSILGYAAEGAVFFSYALLGADYPTDGFSAEAHGDVDDNGDWSIWFIHSGNKELGHRGDPL